MSALLDFISEHDNWEELLALKCVKVKRKDNLAIFNYELNMGIDLGINIDFLDPVVRECRGIIVDLDTNKIVCHPFDKFGNYTEYYADDIDWSTARVQDKIDGSLIKLYWYNGKWNWATNGMIDAEDAPTNSSRYKTYLELIKSAINYKNIPFYTLDKECTYMFELTSPENRVVIEYNYTQLWHIGTRHNKTGIEFNLDIGIVKPSEYSLKSLDDCVKAVEKLNKYDRCDYEGFVVVDSNYHRVKIKSMAYLTVHRLKDSGNNLTKKRMIELIVTNANVDKLCSDFPNEACVIYWYKYQMAKLERDVASYITFARSLWEEYEHDRRAFALQIKNDKFSGFGFKAIDGNESIRDIIYGTKITTLEKFVEDFKG